MSYFLGFIGCSGLLGATFLCLLTLTQSGDYLSLITTLIGGKNIAKQNDKNPIKIGFLLTSFSFLGGNYIAVQLKD